MRLDPAVIRHQVDGLLAAYPELVEDEVLRLDMIEGSTDLVDFVRRLRAPAARKRVRSPRPSP